VCHISEPDNPDNPVVPFRLANGIGRHFRARPQNRIFTYLVLRLGVCNSVSTGPLSLPSVLPMYY
jgi:hypothetical protein